MEKEKKKRKKSDRETTKHSRVRHEHQLNVFVHISSFKTERKISQFTIHKRQEYLYIQMVCAIVLVRLHSFCRDVCVHESTSQSTVHAFSRTTNETHSTITAMHLNRICACTCRQQCRGNDGGGRRRRWRHLRDISALCGARFSI